MRLQACANRHAVGLSLAARKRTRRLTLRKQNGNREVIRACRVNRVPEFWRCEGEVSVGRSAQDQRHGYCWRTRVPTGHMVEVVVMRAGPSSPPASMPQPVQRIGGLSR